MSTPRNEAQRRRIVEMTYAGASSYDIAKALGISASRVQAVFKDERARYMRPMLDEMVADDGHRLMVLVQRYWRDAITGDLNAAKYVRDNLESIRKLYGTAAPSRYEVNLVDRIDTEIARLAAELEAAEVGDAPTQAQPALGPATRAAGD